MVDGFVQQYKDGGWISRWSSPGYADLMTGTSSDVAFADAYVKGVQLRRGGGLRGGAEERHRRPAELRRRPQGHGHLALPRLHEHRHPRGHVVGDGGLPQRLRHRAAWARRSTRRPAGARYKEESEYFLNRAQNYVKLFDPKAGFFQGRNAEGDWRLAARRVRPAGVGLRLHRDQRLDLRLHRPAGRPGPGQPVRRPGRSGEEAGHLLRHPGDRLAGVRRLLRRHHPRDDRGARRPDGHVRAQQPARAPHPLHVRRRRPALEDPGEGPRGAVPALHRQRDRPGLPGRRGQRRDVGLVRLLRARLLPAGDGQRRIRDRLPAVHQGDRPPGERPGPGRQGAEQQREERLRAVAEGQRQVRGSPPRCRTTLLASGGALDFDMGPKPSPGAPARTRPRRRSPRTTRCALAAGGRAEGRRRAVRQHLGHARDAWHPRWTCRYPRRSGRSSTR